MNFRLLFALLRAGRPQFKILKHLSFAKSIARRKLQSKFTGLPEERTLSQPIITTSSFVENKISSSGSALKHI